MIETGLYIFNLQ